MMSLTKIKRAVFWFEIVCISLLMIASIGFLGYWIWASENFFTALSSLAVLIAYLAGAAIKGIISEPQIGILTVFWFALFVGSLYFFAQSDREKRLIIYAIPVSIIALILCAVMLFGIAIAGLANQGAGR